MELRQLRYFAAVARHQNFGRAARELNLTQPALSRQILKLEEELSSPLFIRNPAGATLTEAAVDLLPRAHAVLSNVADFETTARLSRLKSIPTIAIGLSPGIAELLAVPLTDRANNIKKKLKLRFMPALMPTLCDTLLNGETAFCLTSTTVAVPGLVTEPLLREQLCLVCRADDERFKMQSISLAELSTITLVLGSRFGVRMILEQATARKNLPLSIIAEVTTAGAAKQFTLAGVAPTVHVASMVRAELTRGELRAIPIRGLYTNRVIAHLGKNKMPEAVSATIKLVQDCVTDMVVKSEWPGAELV